MFLHSGSRRCLVPRRGSDLPAAREQACTTGDHDTGCGTIALECAAFLQGTLAEYWDDRGRDVPAWAWLNLLAHGTAAQIGDCVLRPYRPRRASRNWHIARAYLAYAVLDLTDLEYTLRSQLAALER